MNTFPGNLTEHAYLLIRNGILTGKLPLGADLSRRKLAREFGISIVPVGDALQRLEMKDWWRAGRAWVRAARLCADKASPAERSELQGMAAQLDRLYAENAMDPEPSDERLFELHKSHMRFHIRIAECSGCDEFCQALEKNQILVFNWLFDTASGRAFPPAAGTSPRWIPGRLPQPAARIA